MAIRKSVLYASAISASLMTAISGVQAQSATPPSPPQSAADNDITGLPDIIVTAEKRSGTLQTTPLAIVALSSEALAKAQVRSLSDMQQLVPAFKMGQDTGSSQLYIRGVGGSGFLPGSEGAVAVNLNEIYVSRPVAQQAGLFDVSAIEVLKGPQGTLYGRNATAGLINIASARPTDQLSGFVRAAVGNYRAVNLEGAVGGPLVSDKILLRVAGFVDKHGGYGKNLVTGNAVNDKDAWGVRATLVVKPTADLTGTLIYEHYKESDNGGAQHYLGATGLIGIPGALGAPPVFVQLGGFAPKNIQDIAAPRDSKFRLRVDAVTGILEWSLGPVTLKSITGYRDQDTRILSPLSGGSNVDAFYLAGEPAHQFSQEFQINYTSSRLKATAGLYYFKETDTTSPSTSPMQSTVINRFFGIPNTTPDYLVDLVEIGGTLKTEAKAAFAQASYEIVDNLSLTAGIRIGKESREAFLVNGLSLTQPFISNSPLSNDTPLPPVTVQPKVSFKSTTPKFGIQYQINPRTMIYASYGKGFKSGGYDVTTVSAAYKPEKLTAYEGGLKMTTADRRLRFNMAGFYYDYTNLQVQQVVGTVVVTGNAASARVYGVEAQIDALITKQFRLEASASYVHGRYGKYTGPDSALPFAPPASFQGNHIVNSPTIQAYIGGTYTVDMAHGSLDFRLDTEYSSRSYFIPGNEKLLSQKPYAKVNGFITYKDSGNWQLSAFVKNLTNIDTVTSAHVNTPILGTPAMGSVAPPRTFGVEARYNF